ncbi:hypothetical protein [Halomonas sp. BM-2019]|uniref:hypothetical protein n=1 Tax=Halomonas sp. BM-2019 TaxID=2811227 RepID=UPI001B3C2BBF|nr:MAG: hypothetical protein J5F18_10695 [Halomonas sp. BM-2019]
MGIVPSRLSLLLHGLLAALVAGLVLLYASAWLGAVAAAAMLGVLLDAARRRPCGELRALPRPDDGLRWEWRDRPGRPWRSVSLDCDYLGPWLIGLRLEGRRLWLWPDSSDAASLWRLRRLLVQRRAR